MAAVPLDHGQGPQVKRGEDALTWSPEGVLATLGGVGVMGTTVPGTPVSAHPCVCPIPASAQGVLGTAAAAHPSLKPSVKSSSHQL